MVILSQMGCEHVHCFAQRHTPSTLSTSGMAGAFTVPPHSTSANFAIPSHVKTVWGFMTLLSAVHAEAGL